MTERKHKKNFKQRKRFEKLLQKLKDKGVIFTWYYNGKYIVDWYGEPKDQGVAE